jgi:hypothetical protein
MIDEKSQNYRGGVWTVRHLLYTRPTEGFKRLRKHQDLTVETFVLNDYWSDIFDDHDRAAAKTKLARIAPNEK